MTQENKKVLIVGGTSGIGLAYAKICLSNGNEVIVAGHNVFEKTGYNQVNDFLEKKAEILPLNLTDKKSTTVCLQKIEMEGPFQTFCYTAGIFQRLPLLELTELEWRDAFEINVNGFFLFSKAVIGKMVDARKGNIVVLASLSAIRAPEKAASYVATKGALVTLVRSIAKDYGHFGIRANAISPGLTETPMTQESIRMYGESTIEKCPLRRLGQPEDIASLIDYLVSDRAGWITGQNFIIDGGLSC